MTTRDRVLTLLLFSAIWFCFEIVHRIREAGRDRKLKKAMDPNRGARLPHKWESAQGTALHTSLIQQRDRL